MAPDRDPSPTPGILHEIIECAPIRIFWKDRESRYLGCNTLFARDAGAESPAGVVGRTDFDLAWRDQAEMYRADDRQVMESGVPKIGYGERQDSAAGAIWLRTSKVPLRDADGQACGVLGIYEDVTEQQATEARLRESEQKYRGIFDEAVAAIYVFDTQKRFLDSNQAGPRSTVCHT